MEKKIYIEKIRCIAVLLVVLTHVVAIPIQNWSQEFDENYMLYSLIYSIGNCGVPLFLMISGSLLLDKNKEISISKVYKKMIPRILVPLLIYGFCFAILEMYFDTKSIDVLMIPKALLRVINRRSWGHLWYLYMLLGIYMFLPELKFIVDNMSDKLLNYSLMILIILGYAFPTFNAVFGTRISVNAPLPLCHITSFLLGHIVLRYEKNKKFEKYVYILGILSMIVVLGTGLFGYKFGKEGYHIIARYDDIFIIGMACFIFMFIKNKDKGKQNKLVSSLSVCSFGIYLIHPVIMNVLYKVVEMQPIDYNALISIPGFAIAFIVPVWIVVIVMRKLPILNRLV